MELSTEQAIALAVIAGLCAGIWARWMDSPGAEWRATYLGRQLWRGMVRYLVTVFAVLMSFLVVLLPERYRARYHAWLCSIGGRRGVVDKM